MADVRDIQMNFTANTSQAEAAINKLKDSTERAAVGLDKQAKSSGTATNAMTNFNRIVQDAPFGIMGIANNIDPMVQSFQKLKAETGSTGGALKAMSSILTGPMGMLFGINMLVFAVQVLPGLFSKISASLAGTTEKMKALKDAMKLQTIVSAESSSKNIGEAATLIQLRNSVDQVKDSKVKRKQIIDQINAVSPETLKNLNQRTASEKDLKAAIDKTISSLYSKIDASLTDIFLAPIYKDLAESQKKYYDAQDNFAKKQQKFNELTVKTQTAPLAAFALTGGDNLNTARAAVEMAGKKLDVALANLANPIAPGKLQEALGAKNSALTQIMGSLGLDKSILKFGDEDDPIKGIKAVTNSLKESIFEMIKTDQLLGRLTTDSNFAKYIEQLTTELAKYKEGTPEFNKTLEGIIELKKQQALVFQMRGSMANEDQSKLGVTWGKIYPYYGLKGSGISGEEIRKLDGIKTYFPQMRDEINLDLVKDKNNLLIKEGAKAAKKQYDLYKDYFIDPFVSSFQGEFSKAWNSIFGEANSLLEKFIQSLGESLFNKAVGSAASGILGMIFPGFNLLEAAVGGFGGGDRATVNQIIMDGELIATQKQANRTQAIINRQNALR
jgi:hypothetical protein